MEKTKVLETKEGLFEDTIIKALRKSEEDYKNGRVKEAKDVFKDWGIPYDV